MKKIVTMLLGCLLFSGISAVPVAAAPTNRLAGSTRYATAESIAETMYTGSVQNVLLASSNSYADALSASVLGHKLNAPILLTDKTADTSIDAFDFIANHLSQNGQVYLIGGTGVLGTDFVSKLNNLGYTNITRLGGATRFDTNMQIVNHLVVSANTPVVIASGENYPDALSISSTAAYKGWPIIILPKDTITSQADAFLKLDKPDRIFIAGGSGAVSDGIFNSLIFYTSPSQIFRLSGTDRYDTCSQINNYFSPKPTHIYLASGENFADALAGSVLAAEDGSPLVLINPSELSLPPAITSYIEKVHQNGTPQVTLLGGQGAVPDNLSSQVKDILNGVPVAPKSTVTTSIVPSSPLTQFTFENSSMQTYTLVRRYTFTNTDDLTGNISVTIYPFYNSATAFQKPISDTLTADHNAVITYDTDPYGNTVAVIKSDSIPSGESLIVTNKAVIQVQGYSLTIDGNKLTGKTVGVPTAYLQPEEFIESDSQPIQSEAAALKQSSSSLWDLVQKTHQYVYTSMTYDTLMNGPHDGKGALSAITYHTGVCQDYSDLEAALLRANGIPARVDNGSDLQMLKYNIPNNDLGDGWLDAHQTLHAWVEVYLDPYGWVPTDPTFASEVPTYQTIGQMAPNEHLVWDFDVNYAYKELGSVDYQVSETDGIASGEK